MFDEQLQRISDDGVRIGIVAGLNQTLNLIFKPARNRNGHDSSLSFIGNGRHFVA
jgi:hypothetical protein